MQALRVLRLQCSAVQCSAVQCSAVCGCAWGAPFCEPGVPLAIRAELPACLPAVILFGLGFADKGFTWAHGALFAAMIASTDALAATAILKQGGCWALWRVGGGLVCAPVAAQGRSWLGRAGLGWARSSCALPAAKCRCTAAC